LIRRTDPSNTIFLVVRRSFSSGGGRAESGASEGNQNANISGELPVGEVAFEVDGPFDHFLNCHARVARKATGTAHSCEVIVQASAFAGFGRSVRHGASTCPGPKPLQRRSGRICGSPMPHLTRQAGARGDYSCRSFDEPLDAAPEGIFIGRHGGLVRPWGGADCAE